MSAAPEPRGGNGASANQRFHFTQRLPARRPGGPRSSRRSPVYVSFVHQAVLWERGLGLRAARHHRPAQRPAPCPRFLSHMKARPSDLGPPRFPSSESRPPPPSREEAAKTHALAAPRTQTLDGFVRLNPDGRGNAVQLAGRRPAVVVPCPPLSAAPPPPAARPAPPRRNDHERRRREATTAPPPSSGQPAPEGTVEVRRMERESTPEPVGLEPSSPPPSPPSTISRGSFSDFSRPPSSLFSRSTDLASGRSSVLPGADSGDSDPEGGVRLSPLAGSSPRQPPAPPCDPAPPPRRSGDLRRSEKPLSGRESSGITTSLPPDAPPDRRLHPATASDRALVTTAFPSATWSSCPSPQRTTPSRSSGSGPPPTPSASGTGLESRRWSVLPPISPAGGRCVSAASRYSELSCSQSHVFDELEAIAPRSTSCPSGGRLSDSSGCPSPDRELSPGLAALTVGCDSGNLGSLSRVRLLLLDRPQPETLPGLYGPEEDLFSPTEDWSDLRMRYAPEGSSRVEGGLTDEEEEEEANYLRWGGRVEPGSLDDRTEEKERRMEEGKTKVLNLLSKLQDEAPRPPNGSKGCSDFEDFDFLAKFCIFSQETLAEYKRAFEAEDADGDGYVSCLQALLALKSVIPPELLSDEEEIYVYRILEMVDFRVADGLVDLRLFAVIASLAQKIAAMDDFMRSLITDMDFRSLEVRLFKVKQLFLFLLEEQEEGGAAGGFISAEQLLLELKAGGIHQDAAVRLQLQRVPPLDLLDFLAYLPLFMLIHKSVITNPLDDAGDL
ncbi:uncharacterized protein C6orf132 isoform X2 [Pseudoliparis swirei]|uniref:uncharacterized protein C6orf132 isoform X2 n=1 Tax=Pseudoliparis swirei TaxID=2059687 RepID=UPI0024BDE564|nr:uncharacterized protein C6orf132 isoform X2 [Pseudoliparis swirei]